MLRKIQKILLATLNLLVYGNLLVAFGAYSLCLFYLRSCHDTELYLHSLPLFIFFATLFTYNFHRRMGLEVYGEAEHSVSVQWMIRHPIISKTTTLISFAAAVYFFMDLPKSSYGLIAPLALLSLMYVINFSDRTPLRQIPFLKLFLIAIAWSASVVLLSTLSLDFAIDKQAILLFLSLSFYMIAEILPFDIRDMHSDQKTDLKTIPNYLGIGSSISLAVISLLLSNVLFLYAFNLQLHAFMLSWLIASAYLSICLILCHTQRSDIFYSLLVETSLILPFLCFELMHRLGLALYI